jgi:hypothetical protein
MQKSKISALLWRCFYWVERRPRWQRLFVQAATVVLIVALGYLWVSSFDCLFC